MNNDYYNSILLNNDKNELYKLCKCAINNNIYVFQYIYY